MDSLARAGGGKEAERGLGGPEVGVPSWGSTRRQLEADGHEVVIFAPHITEVSYTHGAIIDEIGEPLLHMLRNAVDHGIETPQERERAGKAAILQALRKTFGAGEAGKQDLNAVSPFMAI